MKRLILSMALAGMVFIPSLARAETAVITETQIIQAAMQASPDFQAVFRDAEGEKADAEQAARLENPTIDFSVERASAPGGNINSYEIEIEQAFRLSQLTGRRALLSHALFERAELRRQHGILQAFWNTKMLYAEAWQYQEQARLYADFQKRAQDTAASINKSVKAGQTPVSEGSLFAGDAAKFGSDLEKIKARQTQILLRLEKATGLNLAGKALEKPTLAAFNDDMEFLENQARHNASLVKLLEADLRAAERQREAAFADSAGPEIAPRFIYGRTPDDRENTMGVGIALTIPLWDRNQSERRKAEAERIYARRQLDTLQALPLAERLGRTLETVRRLDRRIQTLENDALPNYRKGFEQAQKSFRAGQTDAAALWQIRERLFNTEQDVIEAMLEAIEARRILSLETGLMPQEMTLEITL